MMTNSGTRAFLKSVLTFGVLWSGMVCADDSDDEGDSSSGSWAPHRAQQWSGDGEPPKWKHEAPKSQEDERWDQVFQRVSNSVTIPVKWRDWRTLNKLELSGQCGSALDDLAPLFWKTGITSFKFEDISGGFLKGLIPYLPGTKVQELYFFQCSINDSDLRDLVEVLPHLNGMNTLELDYISGPVTVKTATDLLFAILDVASFEKLYFSGFGWALASHSSDCPLEFYNEKNLVCNEAAECPQQPTQESRELPQEDSKQSVGQQETCMISGTDSFTTTLLQVLSRKNINTLHVFNFGFSEAAAGMLCQGLEHTQLTEFGITLEEFSNDLGGLVDGLSYSKVKVLLHQLRESLDSRINGYGHISGWTDDEEEEGTMENEKISVDDYERLKGTKNSQGESIDWQTM